MLQRVKEGDWFGKKLVDMLEKEFVIGDKVVKSDSYGRSSNLRISTVTQIENEKIYKSNRKASIYVTKRIFTTKTTS
jgi:hypothetical protein